MPFNIFILPCDFGHYFLKLLNSTFLDWKIRELDMVISKFYFSGQWTNCLKNNLAISGQNIWEKYLTKLNSKVKFWAIHVLNWHFSFSCQRSIRIYLFFFPSYYWNFFIFFTSYAYLLKKKCLEVTEFTNPECSWLLYFTLNWINA